MLLVWSMLSDLAPMGFNSLAMFLYLHGMLRIYGIGAKCAKCAECDGQDLEEAIRASEVKAVRKALKAGADPSQPSLEFSLGTPLHLATSDGNLKIVKVC